MIPYPEIVEELKKQSVKRVALQVPEGLKREVPELVAALKREGISAIVSGDPCWGACDLATDAAAGCDVLVHIGHTPVTPEPHVLYFPYRKDIGSIKLDCAAKTLKGFSKVSVTTTIQHAHQIAEIAERLKGLGVNAVIGKGSLRTPEPGQVLGCTYASARNANADANLFIGTGVFHAIGVALATKKPTFSLDPFGSGELQEIDADSLLRKRFVQIEKARKAHNFGILLSSKSGQGRRELAERLAGLHDHAVIIMIREISEMQLRNFGFEAYVNTACPRLSMDDQTRFPVPVLSPAEFEIVLGLRSWDEYVIDEIE